MTPIKMFHGFAVAVILASLLLLSHIAYGQRPQWRTTRAQGELLARIAINENTDPLRLPWTNEETDLISSVVFNNRGKLKSRNWFDLMRHLAPHVGLLKKYTQPQQEWTSTLVGCTTEQPRLWVPARDGNWKQYAENWKTFCESVRDRWVNSTFIHNPYVITWGSTSDLRRSLCPATGKKKKKRVRQRAVCIMTHGIDRNWFLGLRRNSPCDARREEAFIAEYCE